MSFDIWREGDFADSIDILEQVIGAMEADEAEAGVGFLEDSRLERSGLFLVVDEFDDSTCADSFAGLEHDPPFERGGFLGEEDFDIASGGWFTGAEAGGYDPAIVEDQEVSGSEEIWQVDERLVLGESGLPVEGKQAGAVPFVCGMLGDQFRGQWIVEVFDEHGGDHGWDGVRHQDACAD